jgi:signal transduction protein with GAF and PtsI domain
MIGTHSRRSFLFWATMMPAGLSATAYAAGGQQGQQQGQQQDQQDSQGKPTAHSAHSGEPFGSANPDAPTPDPKAVLKANAKDLRSEVVRLAQLAEDLKDEVEKTDSTNVLSMSMLHKTDEIEKLAKHISSLARG